MEYADLDYPKLVRDLRSNLNISSHVLVDSRFKYTSIVGKLIDELKAFDEILISRHAGSFRNSCVGSVLSVSVYRDYNDIIQSTCGRRLDCIYLDREHPIYTTSYLTSRIRRSFNLPNIVNMSGITIFKDM